jgi:sugar phosphate isomerase/epimerase
MKLAASNLALPAFDHMRLLPKLAEFGVAGLEIAPFHTWRIESDGVTSQEVREFGRMAGLAGLEIIGLHGLTGKPLQIEKLTQGAYKAKIMAQLLDLSVICRDLGGRTMILETRLRGTLTDRDAWIVLRAFLDELLPQIESHGTVLCLAPLPAMETDFCATARECYMLTNAVDHPAFGLHLSAAALSGFGAPRHATFAAARGRLELFHIDEPGRTLVGATGEVDHVDFRRHLVSATYKGWVSLVQASGPADQHAARLAAAMTFVRATYFGKPLSDGERILEDRPPTRVDHGRH